MVIQILIAVPEGSIDRDIIKSILIEAGKHLRTFTSTKCDIQYREMDVSDEVLAKLLHP